MLRFTMPARSLGAVAILGVALALGTAGCGPQAKDNAMNSISATDCSWVDQGELTVVPDLSERLDAYAPTALNPDISHLDAVQNQVLDKLVAASKLMDEIFQIQATPCRDALLTRLGGLPEGQRELVAHYFRINMGPWDRRFHFQPFVGSWEHPAGANFYPLDLTASERETIGKSGSDLDGLFTMVRRDKAGKLVAIKYSDFFAVRLQKAAGLLRDAAALTKNPSLKAFLEARADAFMSNDYYQSDMLWMDLDSDVEITIGPYETYEDGLFGYKASFESFVTVADPVESARLAKFKDQLPWLEAHLPIPEKDKNPNRGSDSPIRVVDEVYSGGDTRSAVQTIAFNLPNDERVREAKGSKKVLLRNVMKAKFDQILIPIAEVLVARDQLADLTAESFFLHTLWHEMSHGLGPGKIVKDGRPTEVRLELKETYSTLEEAKADAMGEWDIFVLKRADRGDFPPEIFKQQSATYLAGLFRSVRFGVGEAHGQANAIQFNYLMAKGAISFDESEGRFSIDPVVFERAIGELVGEICVIQARGDYDASVAFIAQYGGLRPVLSNALKKLEGIPVDIEPVFSRYEP